MEQKSFTYQQKINAWEKGFIVDGLDPREYRKDIAGAWMSWNEYGNTNSETGLGWEIDHRKPEAKGGTDDPSNLRAMQWKNNRSKSDNYPVWESSVTSEGARNILKCQRWRES